MDDWNMIDLEPTVTMLRTICDAIQEAEVGEDVNLDSLGYGLVPVFQLNNLLLEAVGPHSLEYEAICGTPLNFQVLELLIGQGADIECLDNEGNSPLYRSVLHDQLREMEFLLEKGAAINKTFHVANDFQGETCLSTAVQLGNHEMVAVLLKFGADMTAPPGILFFAVADSDLSMVRLLIEAGEDVHQTDRATEFSLCDTAFAIAVASEKDVLVHLHESSDSRPDLDEAVQFLEARKLRCLMAERSWRHHSQKMEIIRYLLEKGSSVPSPQQLRHACLGHAFLSVYMVYKLCLDLNRLLEWSIMSCFCEAEIGSSALNFPSIVPILADLIRRTRSSAHLQHRSEGVLLNYLDRIMGECRSDYRVPRLVDLVISGLRRSLSGRSTGVGVAVAGLSLPRGMKRIVALTDIEERFELAQEKFSEALHAAGVVGQSVTQ